MGKGGQQYGDLRKVKFIGGEHTVVYTEVEKQYWAHETYNFTYQLKNILPQYFYSRNLDFALFHINSRITMSNLTKTLGF